MIRKESYSVYMRQTRQEMLFISPLSHGSNFRRNCELIVQKMKKKKNSITP